MADNDQPMLSQDELISMFKQQMGYNKLDLTKEEGENILKQFYNPEFVKLFNSFAQELQTEKGRKDTEETIKQIEQYADAYKFIETQKNEYRVPKKTQKNLTNAQRRYYAYIEKGAKRIEEKMRKEQYHKEEQLRRIRYFEEEYKKHLLYGKNTQSKSSYPSSATVSESTPITTEDYKKLDELLRRAAEFKKEVKTEDYIAREVAGVPTTETQKYVVPLPFKEVFIQDVQLADHIEYERLNYEKIRGYKAVQIRCPVPDGYIKEKIALEVTKYRIALYVETADRLFVLQKDYKFRLKSYDSVAKMKTLSQGDMAKVGCGQYLEITVGIESSEYQLVYHYTEYLRNMRFVEEGETRERYDEDAVVSTLDVKPPEEVKVQLPEELKALSYQFDKTSQKVQVVARSEDGSKTLNYKYAENLQKYIKKVDLSSIYGEVDPGDRKFSFMFRGRVLYMVNSDLTW